MSSIIIDGLNWSIFTNERFKLKMTKYIYSIRDVKADVFLNLFVMKTDEQAKRAFSDLVNNPQTDIARHPEDYQLYNLGFWDQQDGKIGSNVVSLCSGLSVLLASSAHKPDYVGAIFNDKDPAVIKDEDIK